MKRIFLLIMIFMLLSSATASSHFSAEPLCDDVVVKTIVLPVYDSDRVTLHYYAVYAKYEWKVPPAQRKTDGITINWDPQLLTLVSDSFCYQPSGKTAGGLIEKGSASSAPDAIAQGGVGLTFALSDASLPRGTAFIRLAGKSELSMNSRTQVSSSYVHTTNDEAGGSLMVGLSGKGTAFICQSSYQKGSSSADIMIG